MASRKTDRHEVKTIKAKAVMHSNLIVKQENDDKLWAYPIRSITSNEGGPITFRYGSADFATMTCNADDLVNVAKI